MAIMIKDTLPLTQNITELQAIAAKKHGIPTMRGVLYKLEQDDFGNDIFTKVNENTVVIGGAIEALEYLFGNTATFRPSTINSIYNVNNSVTYNDRDCTIKCFGVGTGGSGMDFGNIINPDFKQREILDWIPFRVSDTSTLVSSDASKYFFRRKIQEDPSPQYAWYLKEFENTVVPISRWKDTVATEDGTEITAEVYNSASTNLIECYGECLLKITESDITPYFTFTGNLAEARYNTIGLYSGVKKQIDTGYYDYVGLRLFSVVTMDNVSVKLATNTTYLYRIYAAV